ncbi:MAG TPA: biotin transporter BioY [Pyrinomonadaceae bacterium]|jgi:biotin transport system substrate-specific component
MNASYAKTETLAGAVFAPVGWARSVALVLAFSLLTALAAQVVVPLPFTDVPLTGQTFAVLLTGALLGRRLGALAMIAYLLEGASGLPFFYAGHGGAQHLLNPMTAGYLWSYPFAAFVAGALAERGWDKRFLTAAAAMMIGSLLILLSGWAWRARFMTAEQAFLTGVAPFVLGDIIKVLLAAAALPAGWKLLNKSTRAD